LTLNIDPDMGDCQWLLFKVNSAIFQLYHGKDELHLLQMIMMSSLY